MFFSWELDISRSILMIIVGFGFWGGLGVSYANYLKVDICPQVLGLPVCYLINITYGMMLVALFLKRAKPHYITFFIAWGITFFVAFFSSSFEFALGNICPSKSFGIPQCYVSLATCLVIIGLYLRDWHLEVRQLQSF